MVQFKSFQPHVEVLGEVVAAFIAGFPDGTQEVGYACLARQEIVDPQKGSYYSLQGLLDAMNETADRLGDPVLFRIGCEIVNNAALPPNIYTVNDALPLINEAYHMNHRGGEIGFYQYAYEGRVDGLHRARMKCRNPYPCAFDRGVIDGFARRFGPERGENVIVREDTTAPCRRNGSFSCDYLITWL
jgi:hypothetical protein